jgi:hypothetical protein
MFGSVFGKIQSLVSFTKRASLSTSNSTKFITAPT